MTCEERIAFFFFILTKNQRWCISKMQKKIANGEVIICTVDRAKKKKDFKLPAGTFEIDTMTDFVMVKITRNSLSQEVSKYLCQQYTRQN